jgi:uncharacterized protein (TIGR02147 family)
VEKPTQQKKAARGSKGGKAPRPDIFAFHDYRAFLNEWLPYIKATERGFSLRKLSEEAGTSPGFLPLVLAGKRNLSMDTAIRLSPVLRLTPSEVRYFEDLVRYSISGGGSRMTALENMAQSTGYRRRNPDEVEFFRYMGKWYYPAIRELAQFPGFRADPDWIRPRLRRPLSKAEIQSALRFLFKHGYLKENADGTVAPPKETLHCEGPVFHAALFQHHQQMLSMAAEAIDEVPAERRHVEGYTFSIRKDQFEELRRILSRTLDQVEELERKSQGDKEAVFQVEVAAFPLSVVPEGKKSNE